MPWVSKEPGSSETWPDDAKPIEVAGRKWLVSKYAENLQNLRPGYYAKLLAGNTLAEIQMYAQGKPVFVASGEPVVPEFSSAHMARELEPMPGLAIDLGFDIGGGTLNPGVVFAQAEGKRRWVLGEVCTEDTDLETLCDLVQTRFAMWFKGFKKGAAYLDPAARQRDPIWGRSIVSHLKSRGFAAMTAPTNKIDARVAAIRAPMGWFDSETKAPAFAVDSRRCPMLVRGLEGGWSYAQVRGVDRLAQTPSKNEFSHVCDALGYWLLGVGGPEAITGPRAREGRVKQFRGVRSISDRFAR